MKFGLWTPPTGSRTGTKKSFLGSGPEVISYRLSHKRPHSCFSKIDQIGRTNPLKKSRTTDGRTNKMRTVAYFFRIENTLKSGIVFDHRIYRLVFSVVCFSWSKQLNSKIRPSQLRPTTIFTSIFIFIIFANTLSLF